MLHDDAQQSRASVATARDADASCWVVGYTHTDEGEFLDPNTMQDLASLFPPPAPEETSIAQGFMQGIATQPADAFLTGGDRERLALSPEDEELIQAIAAAKSSTIVAVMGGSSVA